MKTLGILVLGLSLFACTKTRTPAEVETVPPAPVVEDNKPAVPPTPPTADCMGKDETACGMDAACMFNKAANSCEKKPDRPADLNE